MKDVLIYPFTNEMIPILNHAYMLRDINITGLVAFKGNGMLGDEYLVNEKTLKVSEDFDKELEKCMYLLVGDLCREDINPIVLDKIKKAVDKGKTIIYFNKPCSSNEYIEKIIPVDQKIKIETSGDFPTNSHGVMHSIQTPIIFICSLFEGLNKFDTQLAIRSKLINDGYKISQIGTRQLCELFDFHSFPEFMYSTNLAESEKVLMFNNFIKKIEVKNSPDIIVIGIPGGVVPFSPKAVGDLGITMYKIIQAVTPDCTILNIPYGKYTEKEIMYFNKIIKGKFNIDVDYYNMVEKVALGHQTNTTGKVTYLNLDKSIVESKINDIELNNIFCLAKMSDVDKMGDRIIGDFLKYGSIESV